MKINTRNTPTNHGGTPSANLTPYDQLKRTVLTCMLFEDNFYENGKAVADRIGELCKQINPTKIYDLALEASCTHKLRHVPLLLIIHALKQKKNLSRDWQLIEHTIRRPDMMMDLIALYWKDGKKPLPYQMKRALAYAFGKFDEYQLAKYTKADEAISLRDVMCLCHPKPKTPEDVILYRKIHQKQLKQHDTWESKLSAGQDKKSTFSELLESGRMGKLAILRNLRSMHDVGIPKSLVINALDQNHQQLYPFQYLAAARECPQWEDVIDKSMIQSCSGKRSLPGTTIVLVDVSGSMDSAISNKSKMMRMDAACGLAIILRECCENGLFITFSNSIAYVPPRQGMALRDALVGSQPHSGTNLGATLDHIRHQQIPHDRLIVITDEQITDHMTAPTSNKNYMVNVGCYQNGIEYNPNWCKINGFSEATIDYIIELEKESEC